MPAVHACPTLLGAAAFGNFVKVLQFFDLCSGLMLVAFEDECVSDAASLLQETEHFEPQLLGFVFIFHR